MPVDNAVLETTINDLRDRLNVASEKRQNLRALLRDAENIKQIDVPDPTPENPGQTKKEDPMDRALDKKMTPARRNEIYDKVIADHASL